MCVKGMDRFNCMAFFVFFILFIKFKRISLSCHLAIKYLLLICIVMTLDIPIRPNLSDSIHISHSLPFNTDMSRLMRLWE